MSLDQNEAVSDTSLGGYSKKRKKPVSKLNDKKKICDPWKIHDLTSPFHYVPGIALECRSSKGPLPNERMHFFFFLLFLFYFLYFFVVSLNLAERSLRHSRSSASWVGKRSQILPHNRKIFYKKKIYFSHSS